MKIVDYYVDKEFNLYFEKLSTSIQKFIYCVNNHKL